MAKSDDFTYEIVRHIADLSEPTPKGWVLELNLVSWGGRAATYDVRQWNEDHTRCSKGSTFTQEELMAFYEALADLFGELPSDDDDAPDDDGEDIDTSDDVSGIPASFDIP